LDGYNFGGMGKMFLIEKIAEEKILEAIKRGEFRSLILKGKPYRFDGYLYENPILRIEHKILRDHHFLPMPLHLKKKIDQQNDTLRGMLDGFQSAYLKKLVAILNLLEVQPDYPLKLYREFLDKHHRFLSVHLALILPLRYNSAVKLQCHLLNEAILRWRSRYEEECRKLLNLISEYNREIIKATLKKRDTYRNFTTMGYFDIREKLREFDRWFPPVPI